MVDRKTLAWIKAQIEETLDEAHKAPDLFAQNLNDTSPIESCIEPLHKIRGAVEMVNIRGAAMLVTELENLASALMLDNVKHKKAAAEAMAEGMLQLTGYLESLYHGQPDVPLVLLPQLNDLLALQDKELLTEGEFYSPDLSVEVPILPATECLVSGEIEMVAKKLRPGYLSGLLGVIQEVNPTENLEKLITVIDNLLHSSSVEKVRQLWWITSGLVDSLYDNGLKSNVAIKILLGRIDQQIKQLIDHGEQYLADNPPDQISKNLLYYISQSESYNKRVIEIKKAFNLDCPDDSDIEKSRENLGGFNVHLIETVSTQVKEELDNIKDALEASMYAKSDSSSKLESAMNSLGTVADALGMLGMNTLRNLLVEYKEFLGPKITMGESLGEEDLMGIAAALIHVESSISDFSTDIQGGNAGDLPPAEYKKLLKIVAQEIIKDIQTLKTNIIEYREKNDMEVLQQAPKLLKHINGAMEILGFTIQSNLAKAVGSYIQTELLDASYEISHHDLELLADAIVGMEYYYESMLEQSVAPDVALKIAAQSLTDLGYPPETNIWDISNHQLEAKPETSLSMAH